MSKSVKGTRTEQNLLKAFAGESQARTRYTFFASVAKKEGYEQIAGVFAETADQEKEHAKRFFKFLEGGDLEITASYPAGRIGTTAENLLAAAKGENEEWDVLYPDFANAYLNRSALRYALHNPKAAKRDEEIAQRKIAEYKSHLKDSTYSIYADTTQRMDKLLAFDNQFTNSYFDRISEQPSLGRSNMRLLPLFRFTLMQPDTSRIEASNRYTLQRVKDFEKKLDNPYLVLSNRPTNIGADSLAMLDSRYAKILRQNPRDWLLQVQYAISQSLIRQFTNSVGAYSSAIADNAANPFLYFNRAVTRAEMIDFISGLDNPYQRISIDSDPANKLTNTHARTYNYDEAIADLDKTLRLFPNFAEAYYNRGTLLALSGKLPEAFEDFSRAIELNPLFAEAFYNRGMTQIYMKDTRKGCLDLSKAGELGITSAYEILKRYTGEHTEAF